MNEERASGVVWCFSAPREGVYDVLLLKKVECVIRKERRKRSISVLQRHFGCLWFYTDWTYWTRVKKVADIVTIQPRVRNFLGEASID